MTSAKKRPILERAGVGFFKRRHGKLPPVDSDDAVHYLNPEERKALRDIQNRCIMRAAIAGAISAGVVGVFDAWLFSPLGIDPEDPMSYWTAMALITGLTAAVEIAYLYFDALRSVHDLAHAAGLDLFDAHEQEAVAAALARAALELPNPPERVFGVDPRKEVGRLRLVLITLAYKAKIGVTNFLIKALIRRAMGRAVVRGLLSFIAVPVTAAWNAAVAWKVLREARIRVMGRSAAVELCRIVFEEAGALSPLARDTIVRAVGSSIVRTHDMHPNLEYLLKHVTRLLDEPEEEDVDDPLIFLSQLTRISFEEQQTALRILNVAVVIDGRLTRAEKDLVKEALSRCGYPATVDYAEQLRRAFVRGDPIPPRTVLTIAA